MEKDKVLEKSRRENKDQDEMERTIRIEGDGPIRGLTVTADSRAVSRAMRLNRLLCCRPMQRASWMWAAHWARGF